MKGTHIAVEREAQESTDLHHLFSGITYQVFIQDLMNMNTTMQEPVTPHSQRKVTHQGSMNRPSPAKTPRVLAGPHYASTYICRIAPDNHEPSIWELSRQASKVAVGAGRLVAPNSSAFLAGVFSANRLSRDPGVRNVRGYSADIDLMAF